MAIKCLLTGKESGPGDQWFKRNAIGVNKLTYHSARRHMMIKRVNLDVVPTQIIQNIRHQNEQRSTQKYVQNIIKLYQFDTKQCADQQKHTQSAVDVLEHKHIFFRKFTFNPG